MLTHPAEDRVMPKARCCVVALLLSLPGHYPPAGRARGDAPGPLLGQVRQATLEEQSRSPVVAGLQGAITALRRDDRGLYVRYKFRWVRGFDDGTWWLRWWEPLVFSFYDSQDYRIPGRFVTIIFVAEDFVFGQCDRGKPQVLEGETVVSLPPGAKFLAFELGRSGIVTKPVPIPR
jgi:hypothetical protein